MQKINVAAKTGDRNKDNWSKTVGGLRQYLPTGIYHTNLKINGQLIRESSGCDAVTVAKKWLVKRKAQLQENALPKPANRRQTMGELLEKFKFRFQSSGMSPKTKEKKLSLIASLLKTWPLIPEFQKKGWSKFEDLKAKEIDSDDLLAWRNHYRSNHGPDYTNRTVSQILKPLFENAKSEGLLLRENPTYNLDFLPIPKRALELPSQEQFDQFLERLQFGHKNQPKTLAKDTRDFVEGLAYTGLRKEEAQLLRVCHVDTKNWQLNLPAQIVKNRQTDRTIPLAYEAIPLFERLVRDADPQTGAIFKVGKRIRSLKRACEQAGIPRLTLHKLRHYFATVAYESTGNAQIVAELLGHKDGGKLVHSTYAHVRKDFLRAAVSKIMFRKPTSVNLA